VRDARTNPRIAAPVFPALWFLMFAARRPSFNALVQLRASKAIARWLGVARMPSASEMAIVSESADIRTPWSARSPSAAAR
jgi:hypothetical protein